MGRKAEVRRERENYLYLTICYIDGSSKFYSLEGMVMSMFATEFSVKKDVSFDAFRECAIEWIRGIRKSTVLKSGAEREFFDDDAKLEAPNGELYVMKQSVQTGVSGIGFKHDLPDADRIWRTECVLTRRARRGTSVRIRSQCLATAPNIPVMAPKKPFLIKMMLKQKWGGEDSFLRVADTPHRISPKDMKNLKSVILGTHSCILPVVYVSVGDDGKPLLDTCKLAFNLGGLAHVVVEPSREFSFRMTKATSQKNPYGGTIGVSMPGKGIVRVFYKGPALSTSLAVATAIEKFVIRALAIRSAVFGWEWHDLQEQHANTLKTKMRDLQAKTSGQERKEVDEYVEAFDAQISSKNEEIARLEATIDDLTQDLAGREFPGGEILSQKLLQSAGRELYPGEFADRVLLAMRTYVCSHDVDQRTAAVLKELVAHVQFTGQAKNLARRIQRACGDPAKMPGLLDNLLTGEFSFTKRSDGKHMNYFPPADLPGLDKVTVAKSPSDRRAGKNQASELLRNFGLRPIVHDRNPAKRT